MQDAEYYMQRCLALGRQAAEKGNVAVGALVVKDDEIISEGKESVRTSNDVTCHAEIEAIRYAVKNLVTNDLSDCILYSTHEPCIMCSYAIRFYKIKQVVYLRQSKYLGGVSSSLPLLSTDEVPPHWSKAPLIIHMKEDI